MTTDESKLEILKKVEDGTLSVEEGADLIGILDRGAKAESAQGTEGVDVDIRQPVAAETPRVSGCWKATWSMILLGGAVLMAFSAYWVYLGFQKAGLSWGFWLSWIPFLIGLAIMILGWILMDSPWLHVRVRSSKGEDAKNITISMPLPLRIATWVMRRFGHYMPAEVRDKGIDEMLEEVEASLKRGEPFVVEVDDKEDGEKVNIYISK